MDFDLTPLLSDPAAWAALISLVVMEVVLGIDNLIFISILSNKLPEADREGLDEARAIALMVANPSCIKRPVVEHPGGLLVGFKPDEWAASL